MTRTTRPAHVTSPANVVCHRDGTITLWSCHRQQWQRGIPTDRDLAELDSDNYDRVQHHLTHHVPVYDDLFEGVYADGH